MKGGKENFSRDFLSHLDARACLCSLWSNFWVTGVFSLLDSIRWVVSVGLLNMECYAFFVDRYKLTHLVRTHNGADDEAYQCVYQCEDKDGIVGVRLSKELMKVAGRTLKQNITELGPKVLPLSEILLFAGNMIIRKVNFWTYWSLFVVSVMGCVCVGGGGGGGTALFRVSEGPL
jgi:hypothetical protein